MVQPVLPRAFFEDLVDPREVFFFFLVALVDALPFFLRFDLTLAFLDLKAEVRFLLSLRNFVPVEGLVGGERVGGLVGCK